MPAWHRQRGPAATQPYGSSTPKIKVDDAIRAQEQVMTIVLDNVLSTAEVLRVRESLAHVPFRDGRATAGPAAREVKQNEQADGSDVEVGALARLVKIAIERHPTFYAWARPLRWSNLMFSRYVSGHRYGAHTDDAYLRDDQGWPLRTDLSFTLFLSDPNDYDGGALKFLAGSSERSFRPAAGSAVLYATGLLHEVTPVTSGVRLACVGWVQSFIRRADQREVLFDLDRVRHELTEGPAQLHLDKAIGNLLRMWGES
jgi:PKHD-type hydroxylase